MHEESAFIELRSSFSSYTKISDNTWNSLKSFSKFKALKKSTLLYQMGNVPTSFSYIFSGLVRCFSSDNKGNEYNKMFFDEGKFPGSMTALLTSTPSLLTFETIEDTFVIEIDFKAYRALMLQNEEIKLFQIYYLEKNWLLEKEGREIEIVQDDATARYLNFVNKHSSLIDRLPQYHIASHLGITPTQLSRIRKNI